MNQFWLAFAAEWAAELHNDAHIIKMPLEAVQVLYSALRLAGIDFDCRHIQRLRAKLLPDTTAPYKSTHTKHPCVLWTAASRAHMMRTLGLARSLTREYTRRYRKMHKCSEHFAFLGAIIEDQSLPNAIQGGAPDEPTLRAWLDARSAAECAAAAASESSRKRKRSPSTPPPDMAIATVEVPFGVYTLPLAMPAECHVRDASGALRGVGSYCEYYLSHKLLVPHTHVPMYTYGREQVWPASLAAMSADWLRARP